MDIKKPHLLGRVVEGTMPESNQIMKDLGKIQDVSF
jgi:hypothetical protein